MKLIKNLIIKLSTSLGIKSYLDIALVWRYRRHFFFVLKLLKKSNSQISQDVFVASELKLWEPKKRNFYVEFGASDGVYLSNTLILENMFNWDGILVEPAKVWHHELLKNRNCKIDFRCVENRSGDNVLFHETGESVYSTIDQFSDNDLHSDKRLKGKKYFVATVSLNDLLSEMNAPQVIDYLSIDTEGSEYRILQSVDFIKFKFRVITVEHNFTQNRSDIFELLSKNGYTRVMSSLTKMDDWYVLTKNLNDSRLR